MKKIIAIGVGGGGTNAINYMSTQGIKCVDFVVCNTDVQSLENSPVPNKIQLDTNLIEDLSSSSNTNQVLENINQIKQLLNNNVEMVFITAGMGGETGTGIAPMIAQLAKERDILTVGVVTIPFEFEGKLRRDQALVGVDELRRHVDLLITINNNKLREVYGNLGFKAGFAKADEVLANICYCFSTILMDYKKQYINREIREMILDSGVAMVGSAISNGNNRAKEAIMSALESPLLNENTIKGAKKVFLIIVTGSREATIDEIGIITNHIQTEAGFNANIIMGVDEDEKLKDSIEVIVIATGFS